QKTQLAGQVKSAYVLGRQEQLKLLFNQQDAGRTSRIMTYYQYFNKARLDKLSRLNNSLQLLNTLETEKQLERQQLTDLINHKTQQQNELDQTAIERKKILAKIKKEYRQGSTQLSRLKKDEQQLKRLITKLQQAVQKPPPVMANTTLAFHQLKGKLPWPVKGKVIRSFGSSRSGGKWNGTLIKANKGKKIKAIAHGQVIFSDWFKGYGLLVIIKHDSQYISLYAFNQSLYKNVGDWVEAGDILATVGNSGGRDKPGLYFEIRQKDRPVNPKKWCKKKR
ncbi:MAG: peptidoglycan DD-metalloendopeptidase family protein, partial [Methyloprofundus sp.]|nr:peptidoglycan DD-metalloendopeptidase family protein [Methyloprofundus sp.]